MKQSENHSPNRPVGCLLATNIPIYIAFDGSPERPATILEVFVFTVMRRYSGAGVKPPLLTDLEDVVWLPGLCLLPSVKQGWPGSRGPCLEIFGWKSPSLCVRAQLCPTLCNPVDCSPPGSSVHGVSQARILEWVAISFSRGSSLPRDQSWVFCIASRFFITEPPGKPLQLYGMGPKGAVAVWHIPIHPCLWIASVTASRVHSVVARLGSSLPWWYAHQCLQEKCLWISFPLAKSASCELTVLRLPLWYLGLERGFKFFYFF